MCSARGRLDGCTGGNMRAVLCIIVAAMSLVKSATRPEKKKPDKNQYWLLNPTPPDEMRSFNTDRPTKANVPYTVDAGHFQYETDLVNFTHQVIGSVRTNTIMVPNPTFKVGVTNNALEVNVPFVGVHTFGSSTAPSGQDYPDEPRHRALLDRHPQRATRRRRQFRPHQRDAGRASLCRPLATLLI
jgi:hypothetical protein